MTFEQDVFISYARLDNQALVEGQQGWIANFHRAFEIRAGQYLGRQPNVWRDPKLHGNDVLSETLVTTVQHSAIMISILSPRYVRSEWTLREVTEFLKAAKLGPNVGSQHRIFKILKTPLPLDQHPSELQSLLGYEFFQVDPETGRPRELDQIFGPGAQREFWLKVDDVAQDVCNLLQKLEADRFAGGSPVDLQRSPVFLAVTTSDAAEQRETLRRDLLQHGYEVLPLRPLGTSMQEVESSVREDLRRCRMSVHLLGSRYGLIPEDGVESVPEIQQRLAVERSQETPFTRLVWIPRRLTISDPRQSKLVDRLRSEMDSGGDSDLLETSFEDLRSLVQQRLQVPPAAKSAAPVQADTLAQITRIFFIYDQRDLDSLEPWLDHLFNSGLEILHPAFEGEETEVRECQEENLRTCDAVLIHYGAANEMWLRRKLREIQKIAGLGRTQPMGPAAVLLAPPVRPEKRIFRTHEALLIQQLNGFSPAEFAPFLTSVGYGRRAQAL